MRSRLQNVGLLVAVLLVALFVGLTVYSQVLAPNEVFVGQQFHVEADHTGADTTSFELRQDGALVATVQASVLANGVLSFPARSIAQAGTYTLVVSAVGPGGSTPGDPFTLVVRNRLPFAPANTRIQRVE